jgi:hypothetical protein
LYFVRGTGVYRHHTVTKLSIVFCAFFGLYRPHYSMLCSIAIGLCNSVLSLIALYYATFQYFKRNLYLDAGLSNKHDVAKLRI